MTPVRHINVQGVRVSALNPDLASEVIHQAITAGDRGYICVQNVHGITKAQSDPALRKVFDNALLITPDGVPIVWLGRLAGDPTIRRVYGPDLMLRICEEGVPRGYRHFLYGGKAGVVEKLQASLKKKFPGIQIVGNHTPPFRPLSQSEEKDLISEVRKAKPDIVWVGLSTPKQDHFMAEHIHKLDTTLMFGVGAAFDFHAGLVPQAPSWMQACGLEWLFRLLTEPRRLWRRYFYSNPIFVFRVACELLGFKRRQSFN